MRIFMFTVVLLLVISYVDIREATRTISLPASSGHGASHPNSFVTSAVAFNQPAMAYAIPALRTNFHTHGRFIHRTPLRFAEISPLIRLEATNNRDQARVAQSQRCSQLDSQTDRQIQTYISSIEVLTSTIQELDEAVQLIRGCEDLGIKPVDGLLTSPNQIVTESTASSIVAMTDEPATTKFAETSESGNAIESATPTETATSTETATVPATATSSEVSLVETTLATSTESFTDTPIESRLRKRDGTLFGLPSTSSAPVLADQANEDLAKASSDLKALRKDLGKAAEWMKQTNYTIHSVVLRALQAYVTSIERRVDHQRQLNTSAKGIGLKLKIAIIKEKVAVLLEKLKSLVPFKQANISRDDRGSISGITTTAAGTFNNNVPTTLSSITSPSSTVSTNP